MLFAVDTKASGSDRKECSVLPMPPARSPEEAYYRYADMVFRLAMARCRSRSDAEDVLQEVFVRYMRSAPEFETSEHQRAWLIKTTINRSNSWLSSAWKKHTAELNEDVASSGETGDMDTASDVYNAVMNLPKAQRTAVHLYYYEGYRVSEIAELTDSNESTVKSWLRRARVRLEKELKGDYFDV